ncbi:MAG: dipeptidase [Limnochordaceae bacterium]|nr:dipeptidase [Limnochordaceae bacterium]
MRDHDSEIFAGLGRFLRLPSISTLPEHAQDVQATARFLAEELQRLGVPRVELIPTAGHPLVYGEWTGVSGRPTVLIYGHYDVQPVDPVDQWKSDPFTPTLKEGDRLYARGASDDKGPVWAHLAALQALLQTAPGRSAGIAGSESPLPINVKLLFEGEEEVSSKHLMEFVNQNAQQLSCDLIVISDTTLYAPGVPAVCYGLRGIVACQIDVFGPAHDLHSGTYGGVVANPVHELSRLLASFHDEQGRVNVDGFYEDVRPLSAAERRSWASLPFDPHALEQEAGVPALAGEPVYTPLERMWARPTLEVNGIWGGFQGSGTKTIIPASAHAKVTCRLVPDQDPVRVLDCLEAAVRQRLPATVRAQFTRMEGGRAWIADPGHPALQKAAAALRQGFGAEPVFIRMGGSIPVVSTFSQALQKPVVLMGFSLPNENFHAPNEHVHLDNLRAGMRTLVHYWLNL